MIKILEAGKYDINIKMYCDKGWIEREGEAIAGLWFTNNKLTDYDGISQLPKIVVDTLIANGYIDQADADNY